jgi:hypothetical protein
MSEDEVSFDLEFPELERLPTEIRDEILREVGDYLKVSILDYIGDSKSPVSGGKFKASLSPAYAEREGKDRANLDLTGSMLDSLDFEVDGTTLRIGIFDSSQTPKAYNHNVGDTLPQRQFIPLEGQTFKRDIMGEIDAIIGELLGD